MDDAYDIIVGFTPYDLKCAVNTAIAKGYVPSGGPCADNGGSGAVHLCQAVFKAPKHNSMLSEKEKAFLINLRDGYHELSWPKEHAHNPGQALLKEEQHQLSAALQSLIDRGYCKLSRALCGPLQTPTGETFIVLTEAGEECLQK